MYQNALHISDGTSTVKSNETGLTFLVLNLLSVTLVGCLCFSSSSVIFSMGSFDDEDTFVVMTCLFGFGGGFLYEWEVGLSVF